MLRMKIGYWTQISCSTSVILSNINLKISKFNNIKTFCPPKFPVYIKLPWIGFISQFLAKLLSSVSIYPTPGRMWHTVNFLMRSLTELDSELFFSETGFLTKAEESSLPKLFTQSWMKNKGFHTFPKGNCTLWNAIKLIQDLNSCRRVHFLRR